MKTKLLVIATISLLIGCGCSSNAVQPANMSDPASPLYPTTTGWEARFAGGCTLQTDSAWPAIGPFAFANEADTIPCGYARYSEWPVTDVQTFCDGGVLVFTMIDSTRILAGYRMIVDQAYLRW